MATQEEGKEYDVVIAGGGTAACIIAGRLARTDPELSILVIEGGKNNLNNPLVTNPAMYLAHLAPDSQTALFYKSEASEHLNGREAIVPMGGCLGGGSSINFMMYTRAQAVDFDSWKTEGWDYKSLLPCLKRLETYHTDDKDTDWDVHGTDGPINVSRSYYNPSGPEADFMEAAQSMGIKEIKDLQDFRANDGFSRWSRYVCPNGKRQDTAHRYVHNAMADGQHPNLHLLTESKVVRVLFDENNKANGVEYVPTKSHQPEIALSKPKHSVVKAKKMVIVSAGALGTPSVLERSGLGSKEVLSKLNIPVVSDLPGVGENYQDHHLVLYPYKTNLKEDETLDGLIAGRIDFTKAVEEKNKILGWNGIDISSKLRPSEEEVAELGPDFQEQWDTDFKDAPERPVMLMGVVSTYLGDHSILPDHPNPSQYATMGTYTAYPYSRGNIHIRSQDVAVPARFDAGFLNHPADLKKQLWAYKKQREIYRRTLAYQGEFELGHPKFPEGSKAALSEGPVIKGVEDRTSLAPIEYSKEDDAAIEDWIRENVGTTWHSMGTCKMAPRAEGGVVDKDLNVYGVTGLKLADLSICPENVAANTNNTALCVGEKAADLIAKDLGLPAIVNQPERRARHDSGSGGFLRLSDEK